MICCQSGGGRTCFTLRLGDSVEEVDEVEDITEEEMIACTEACYQSSQLYQVGNLAL